ncbi:MAG: hypothetical protein WD096_02020 [Actinomycetota bacterium]
MIACIAGLSGCATNGAGTTPTDGSVEVNDFVRSTRWLSYDHEPTETVEALATKADIVVEGVIDGVAPGQSYAPTKDSEPELATSVLSILVEDVLAGDGTFVVDAHIFLEIVHPAFHSTGPGEDGEGGGPDEPFDHDAYAETVPIGVRGIYFLGDVTDEPYWEFIQDEGAGRPSGAPIMHTHPQGFLIQASGGPLVSVLEELYAMPKAWQELDSLEDVRASLASSD